MTVPQDVTSDFIGREAELTLLTEMLGASRLITVTGTGGVGKTRLALCAAQRASGGFPDGVRLIELSALRDPRLLAQIIAAGLGIGAQDARPQTELILSYLAERRMVLILDTCEHLLDECALFAEKILAEAPGVTILATSRQSLDVPGEQGFPLEPLAVPGTSGNPESPGSAAGEAVELFARRAREAVPGFTVTGDNRDTVIGLCQRLGGVPLAIELAAARLRTLDLEDLSGQLDRALPLLARPAVVGQGPGGGPGSAPRHRALRDAIGWSYELCSPQEQRLWERLSVFAGPVGLDAVEQVCAGQGLEPGAVMDAAFGLVDKSVLLPVADDGSADGAPRYRMLDTVREYGAERLAASGIEAGVRTRLVHRYLALAEEFDASPLEGQLERYRALRREHASLRAALGYAFSLPGQELAAARLPSSLHWYWQISGLLTEGGYWLGRVLELFPRPTPARARALGLRGFLAAYGGDSATSLADTEAALSLAEQLRDRKLLGRAWLYQVRALLTVGRLAEAEEAAHTATGLLTASGDTGMIPILDVMLAFKHWTAGELDQCLARCDVGLRRVPVDEGERWASSYLLGLTGLAMFAQGKQEEGSASTRKAMAMKQELDDTAGIAYGLSGLAIMAAGEGRFERVTWLLGAADPLWDRLGTVFGGTPEMLERTRQIIAAARATLGEEQYARVFRTASELPLDTIVTLAVQNDDELPSLAPC